MKIYSSKRCDNELDKFVGTDLWVKVRNKSLGGNAYIHILKSSDDSYVFNECFADDESLSECVTQETKDYFTSPENAFIEPKSNFELIRPIDCVSTDELFPME